MSKRFATVMVVVGAGPFPFDMLRYDTCVPKNESDSSAISEDGSRRLVMLTRLSVNQTGPTHKRWESFGWRVIWWGKSGHLPAHLEVAFGNHRTTLCPQHGLLPGDAQAAGVTCNVSSPNCPADFHY